MSSEVNTILIEIFHFSNKKHKDNFVFQIKRCIFANGNCRSGEKQFAPTTL